MIRAAIKRFLARHMLVIEFCHDCGVRQPLVWTAPDDLWADVSGEGDGGGVLCPRCFTNRADALGYFLRWVPQVETRTVTTQTYWGYTLTMTNVAEGRGNQARRE
jgi:hypothetical protein